MKMPTSHHADPSYDMIEKAYSKKTTMQTISERRSGSMGFHPLDLILILAIGLLILGPKSVQTLSRHVGKTVGQAKEAKDKLLAELPMEELEQVRDSIAHIPLSPQQAAQMLLTPEQEKKPAEPGKSAVEPETSSEQQNTTEVPHP
jgi:Sec-independent protein translocase protein TatA